MIGFGLNIGNRVMGGGGGGGFDADAQAFFTRVTTAGGTLSTTEKNATNQLVLDMKSAGIWSSMKAVYPMVGASAAACAQNLKSSSFTGTFSSGWTFASTGVKPNGSSAYMDTGLIPLVNISNYNSHVSFYSTTTNLGGIDLGAFAPASNFYASASYVGTNRNFLQRNDSDGALYTPTKVKGLFVWNAPNQSLSETYEDGILKVQNTSTTIQSRPNISVTLSAFNQGSKVLFSARECAFASIGDGLTSTQALNFYTAVQAFQTTLSRNV